MRFDTRRGVARSFVLASALAVVATTSARADGFRLHTIPRVTPALDYRTGQQMMAPPIPYGHYAADPLGQPHRHLKKLHGMLLGKVCGLCGLGGCGLCGGLGHLGGALCGGCGGDGCGHCDSGLGHGGLSHGGLGHGLFGRHPLGGGHHGALCGPGQPCASSQGAPSGQAAVAPSGQVLPCHGCAGRGVHGGGGLCGLCGGKGLLGGHGFGGHGEANLCDSCGGAGCGLCGGTGLKHLLAGLLAGLKGSVLGLLHHPKIEWFVGPGGPVPLTPGYVPYVNPVRSPRDYFAFPPFSEQAQP
jgi:hypothetical protein